MTKNESVSFADIGQTAFYTTSITNIGNTDATNIVFTDALPSGLTFVPNTLTFDGVLQPNANQIQVYYLQHFHQMKYIVSSFKLQ